MGLRNILLARSNHARLEAFGLAVLTIITTLLVVTINPVEVALTHLALLAGTIAIGLMTNIWGGLIASALCVFAVVWFNQYAGIHLREGGFFNIGTELTTFLLAGPLAGKLAGVIKALQQEIDHWLAQAKALAVQDDTFGTLKPEWARVRLDEEALRAASFQRPLSVALLQLDPKLEIAQASQSERVAVLQAVIRVTRAIIQPPSLVTHAGGDEVLVILPEHTADQTRLVTNMLQARLAQEVYFPPEDANHSLGKPLGAWGSLRVGLATLNGQAESGEALLNRARDNLSISPSPRLSSEEALQVS